MNRANVTHAIRIMERAEALDMTSWISADEGEMPGTIDLLHECGDTACFAGYIALSYEFQVADGYQNCGNGAPEIARRGEVFSGHKAVALWLDINQELSSSLCAVSIYPTLDFYGVTKEYVTPRHVIEKLQGLLDGKFGVQVFDG